MAKKGEQNKLLFFEPNPNDNKLIPNEDISIFVELATTKKGRSIINLDGQNGEGKVFNTGGKTTTVRFIDGSTESGVKSLTTDYTQISSFTNPEKDLETLGIESIDIDFDTAYTPLVKIKFIDVRGKSIFEKGSESNYSVFFDLPYPIFSLTIKGYYGRPVKYCLHLLKWNAKFNSSTGNFEIDAEFIGYTYAILTDLLLGYLRAVVYTKKGSVIFDGIKKDYASKGIQIKTIDDFLKDIETIADEFEKLKNEDEEIKELNTSSIVRDGIKTLRSRILSLSSIIIPKDTDYFDNGKGVLCVDPKKAEDKTVIDNIADYRKKILGDLDDVESGLNTKINVEPLKFRTKNITDFITIKDLKYNDFTDANSETVGTEKLFETNLYERDTENEDSKINDFVSDLATILSRNLPIDLKNNPTLLVYDFRKAFNEIDRVERALIDNEKNVREKIGLRLSKIAAEKLNFDPNIRNIFRILTVHCEVFLQTLAEVSIDAEKSESRKKVLKKHFPTKESSNIKEDSDIVYPWPEFRMKDPKDGEKGNYEESWIGGRGAVSSLSEQNKVDEIVFVEDLLEQLLKVAQGDIDAEIENGELLGPQFYPVSPLDTRFSTNLTENPYKTALISDNGRAIPEEATRCLLLRAFLGLGVSNNNLPDVIIEAMGDLEAFNLFNAIKDNFTPSNTRPILTDLNTGGSPSDKTANLINTWKSGFDDTIIKNPFNKKTPILAEDGDEYVYTYITDSPEPGNIDYIKAYIPVSGSFDGKDFYKLDGEAYTLKDVTELNTLSNSVNFVGNNFGTAQNQLDNLEDVNDGSVYLKILSSTNYENGLNAPNYGKELFDKYRKQGRIAEGTIISQNTLLKATYQDGFIGQLDPYSSRYKAQEIFDMVYNGDGSDFIDTGETIIYNKANKKQEKEGSILASFWSQRDYDKEDMGGTYLAKVKPKIDTRIDQFCIGCGRGKFNLNEDRFNPKSYGNQRELLGELLGEVSVPADNEELIYTPYIEFGIANHEDNTLNYFSLFGSKFYYAQNNDEAKALLFLHTFGWQGLIGDIKDTAGVKLDKTDVSLFDVIQNDGDGTFETEDDTPTIKSIFKNNASFLKAPKLWCAFIGGLLYRYHEGIKTGEDIIYFGHSGSTFEQLFAWQDSSSVVPSFNQYLYDVRSQSPFGMNFVFDSGDTIRDDDETQFYPEIDETLLNLPAQVKLEFIGKFKEFIENDFINLDRELRVWDESLQPKTREDLWTELNAAKFPDFNVVNTNFVPILINKEKIKEIFVGSNVSDNYENISPVANDKWVDNIHQFTLKISPTSKVTNLLNNLIKQDYVILNGVPKSFKQTEVPSTEKYSRISVDKVKFEKFLNNFYTRFGTLVDNWEKGVNDDTDDLEQKVFKTMNDDLIKLNIYRGLGSLYNKWIAGTDNIFGQCGVSGNDKKISTAERGTPKSTLIDSFRFLDRAFNDIGDKFYINPIAILNLVRGKYNQSFFDLTNRILSDNNFNFIALPSFLNFNDVNQLKEMFTPFSYNDLVDEDYNVGPSFVCTYVGQTSTNLDLGENSTYPDDGVIIRFDENGQIIDAPEDFVKESGNPRDLDIPMVSVSYGKQNQSYFKDIRLDQREFSETAESLEIIEDISQSGDKRKPTSAGQNLFNVYQTRSYSAEIEMMGNAMMQPMMYFHLSNIPMFRGAYLITKVTHHIKSHSMTTKFKGVRIKRAGTKLIDAPTLFMELLGSLKGLGSADAIGGSNVTNTTTNDTEYSIVPNKDNNDITGIIIEG